MELNLKPRSASWLGKPGQTATTKITGKERITLRRMDDGSTTLRRTRGDGRTDAFTVLDEHITTTPNWAAAAAWASVIYGA